MAFLRKDRVPAAAEAESFAEARRLMVEHQLRGRGIAHSGVLEVMGRLPREQFVPPEERASAYEDRPLHIGHGATISQPYIVALMTEALDPRRDDRVLEIGTGSGYQTAILAELAGAVFTIEILADLAERAGLLLAALGYANVRSRTGDGRRGWPEEAPFDGILLTAAPVRLPPGLLGHLADGGRLVAPVGMLDQRLVLWRRGVGGLRRTDLTHVRFVPLVGEEEP
jgi:protein-L-isoaspartate(D-aspartate) O-methyltransferase